MAWKDTVKETLSPKNMLEKAGKFMPFSEERKDYPVPTYALLGTGALLLSVSLLLLAAGSTPVAAFFVLFAPLMVIAGIATAITYEMKRRKAKERKIDRMLEEWEREENQRRFNEAKTKLINKKIEEQKKEKEKQRSLEGSGSNEGQESEPEIDDDDVIYTEVDQNDIDEQRKIFENPEAEAEKKNSEFESEEEAYYRKARNLAIGMTIAAVSLAAAIGFGTLFLVSTSFAPMFAGFAFAAMFYFLSSAIIEASRDPEKLKDPKFYLKTLAKMLLGAPIMGLVTAGISVLVGGAVISVIPGGVFGLLAIALIAGLAMAGYAGYKFYQDKKQKAVETEKLTDDKQKTLPSQEARQNLLNDAEEKIKNANEVIKECENKISKLNKGEVESDSDNSNPGSEGENDDQKIEQLKTEIKRQEQIIIEKKYQLKEEQISKEYDNTAKSMLGYGKNQSDRSSEPHPQKAPTEEVIEVIEKDLERRKQKLDEAQDSSQLRKERIEIGVREKLLNKLKENVKTAENFNRPKSSTKGMMGDLEEKTRQESEMRLKKEQGSNFNSPISFGNQQQPPVTGSQPLNFSGSKNNQNPSQGGGLNPSNKKD